MNDTDDLIVQLRDGLSSQAEEIDAPAGLADTARRTAHRRVARRAAIAGVPAVIVAAAILALTSAERSPGPAAVDVAYISKHVAAQLTAQESGQAVLYTVTSSLPGDFQAGWHERSWEYAAPGSDAETTFWLTTDAHGRLVERNRDVLRIDHHHARDTTLEVNYARRTWSLGTSLYTTPRRQSPGYFGSDRQLREQIKHGDFTRAGTVTIAGERALRLRVRLSEQLRKTETEQLYVDAASYRPIKRTMTVHEASEHFTETSRWQPATPASEARATRPLSAPAGFKRTVSQAKIAIRSEERNIRGKLSRTTSARVRRQLERDLRKLEAQHTG